MDHTRAHEKRARTAAEVATSSRRPLDLRLPGALVQREEVIPIRFHEARHTTASLAAYGT